MPLEGTLLEKLRKIEALARGCNGMPVAAGIDRRAGFPVQQDAGGHRRRMGLRNG